MNSKPILWSLLLCNLYAGSFPIGGKANTMTYPADAFAAGVNPAGIVLIPDRFDAAARGLHDEKNFEVVGNAISSNDHKYHSTRPNLLFGEFAIKKGFQLCAFDRQWNGALGFVTYNGPGTNLTYYKSNISFVGKAPLSASYWQQVFSPAFALQINNQHAIGVSLDCILYRIRLLGVQEFDNPFATVSPGFVTNNGYDNVWTVSGTLAWRWQITNKFSFGCTVRPKTKFQKVEKYKGYYPKHGTIQNPWDFAAGIAYTFTSHFTMGLDFEWVNFKGCTAADPLLNSKGVFNLLGSSFGPAPGWVNIYAIAVGGGYIVNDHFTVRGGYTYVSPLVPNSQTLYGAQAVKVI